MTASSMADSIAIGLRALAFIAALQAAGASLFLSLFAEDLEHAGAAVRSFAGRTPAAAALIVVAHQLVEPARLTGDLSGVLDGSLQAVLLASDIGTTTSIRILGLALILIGGVANGRASGLVALAGSTLVAVSFALMGHTAAADERWILAPVLFLHLFIVAFWFGALWPLHLATRLESAGTAARVVERFSRLAVWWVPALFLAGVVMAAVLLPDLAALATPYGMLLWVKVSGFALLMGLASVNKWRLGPRIGRGQDSAARLLRVSLSAEWLIIAAVLAVTAVMTGLYSPSH